ncbi:DUF1963 domain-containing protein [bacterium]|nr:MAG: DUF1963 domain-containing protein [bacterium]
MYPTEEFAQRRSQAVEFINSAAPYDIQSLLLEQLRPSISLKIVQETEEAISVGASKFGGVPDVPEGFEWPQWNEIPLGFLAQLNLDEIAPFDTENLLPKSGLLSFFISFDEENEVWGAADQRQGWQVFHFENWGLARSEFMPDAQTVLPALKVLPEASWTLPFSSESVIAEFFDEDNLNFSEDVCEGYPGFYSDFCELFSAANKISGWPNTLQNPIEPLCQAEFASYLKKQDYWDEGGVERWRFVFQFDSNVYIEEDWLYVGVFYFWVRYYDLEIGDFSSTWLMQQIS